MCKANAPGTHGLGLKDTNMTMFPKSTMMLDAPLRGYPRRHQTRYLKPRKHMVCGLYLNQAV